MNHQNDQQTPDILKDVARFALIEIVIATGFTQLSKLLLPQAREETQYLIAGVLIIVIAILWVARLKSTAQLRKAVTIAPLFIFAGIYLLGSLAEQRTLYFIIDASEQMAGNFDEIRRVELESLKIEGENDFGLTVFGGRVSYNTGCSDMIELVEPSPQEESLPKLISAVDALTKVVVPNGEGSLQNAILYVLPRLAGRKGIQQLFVITSGIDSRCENLNREKLEELADEHKVEFELIIVSVGEINEQDEQELIAYADRYLNAGSVIEIKETIEEIISTAPLPYGPYSPYSR